MKKDELIYKQYVQILREELRPAMGCTEPIAIAYASAKARSVLGKTPDRILIEVSGNIIKNVKSVVIPHTGGLRGIPAAVAIGAVAGDENAEFEVISNVTSEQIEATKAYLESTPIEVKWSDSSHIFDLKVVVYSEEESAVVHTVDYHTNIIEIKKNDEIIYQHECLSEEDGLTDRSCMSVESIVDFAESVDLEDVRVALERQIKCNMAIAEEGLKNNFGANIGKTLLASRGDSIQTKMRAYAAVGSDARMNGCELPVVIVSGSGNQGMTASIPVIVYAREYGLDDDLLLRALVVSNLVTTHLKTDIGRLSAYCGAVSAGVGAGAGIAYLKGGRYKVIAHTIVNAAAVTSGIICDGAKASCAAKIASAVDAGLLGLEMYENGNQFLGGDGIVTKGVEKTIKNIGRLARYGMAETDKEIIEIMTCDL